MSWSSVIGQHRVKELFRRALLEEKIAHAYLFWGMEGIGKDALALALAKTLNCERRTSKMTEPCNQCRSCMQADKLEHPNIKLVFSLPAAKSAETRDDSPLFKLTDAQIEEIQEQLRIKAENPYHNVTIANARQIRIASIRDVKRSISMSQSQSGHRVVIISEADEMTVEAANAFLKTLEEPNPNVTLILTTSRREAIPQTIMSRCQQIYCDPLTDAELTQALHQRLSIAEEEARLIASFAQGSYSRAMQFLDEDMRRLREEVIALLRAALRRVRYRMETFHIMERFTSTQDRKQLSTMLGLLVLWLRDVYVYARCADESLIINRDQIDTIMKFATAFPHADYPAAINAAEEAVGLVQRNIHPPLILISLLLVCRRVFLGVDD